MRWSIEDDLDPVGFLMRRAASLGHAHFGRSMRIWIAHGGSIGSGYAQTRASRAGLGGTGSDFTSALAISMWNRRYRRP